MNIPALQPNGERALLALGWAWTLFGSRKTRSQKNACKSRRLPLVGYTLCWATTSLPERWLLQRRKALLTNSHRDEIANDKHDVISLLFVNIFIAQFGFGA
jgi:hypothetical protein